MYMLDEVYAQPLNGNRWKVGTIHQDEFPPDNEWIKKFTGISVHDVRIIIWNESIGAWVIKLNK